jgi:hypothetical protein
MRKDDDQVIVERITGDFARQSFETYRSAEKAGRKVHGGDDRKRQANPPKICACCGKKTYAHGVCKTAYMRDYMRKVYARKRANKAAQEEQQ